MPKLSDIEKLKDIVDGLGQEREIRAKRGEQVEEIAPPEQALSSEDLDSLLGTGESEDAAGTPRPTEEVIADALEAVGSEDAQIDDISQALEETGVSEPSSEDTMGLDVLPEAFGEEPGQALEAASGEERLGTAFEEFELPDFGGAEGSVLDEAAAGAALETAAEPVSEAVEEFSLPEDPGEAPKPTEPTTVPIEEFSLPEGLGEAPEPTEPTAVPVEEFSLPEGFGETPEPAEPTTVSIEEFSLPGGLGEAPEPAESAAEPAPTFDLSDFQISESFAGGESDADKLFESVPETPAEPAPVEAQAEAMEGLQEIEAGIPEITGEPSPSAPETGGFEFPDLGGLGGPETEPGEPLPSFETEIQPQAEEGEFGGVEDKLFDLPEGEDFTAAPAPSGAPPPGAEPEEAGAFAGFEMPDLSEIGGALEAEPPAPGGQEEAGGPQDEGLDIIDTGQFAMPEFEGRTAPQAAEIRELGESGAPEELAGAEDDLQFSQHDFDNIKATLAILPLNLKIAVEDLIADHGLQGPRLRRLLDALIAGESPKAVAAIVSSITGRKIVLPKSFEKRSGIAFERERESFAYFLRTKGARAALFAGAAIVILFLLAYGAYVLVFRPLSAVAVYDKGYEAIQKDLYEEARRKFDEASRIWDSKDQYYRYAEAFVASAAGNYRYADQMYRMLLRRYPGDVKGMIDYARLETLQGNYAHADSLLEDGVLKREPYNYDALAACADNYLTWAEEDDSKLKDAQYYYATLAEHYRERTAAHLKRIDFLIRSERIARKQGLSDVDNTNLVIAYAGFLKKKGWDLVDPAVYTEMASYLIDKNETDLVPELLEKTRAADPGYAPAWYETARNERLAGKTENERRALEKAIDLFRNSEQGNARGFQLAAERRNSLDRSAMLVLALNRLGEYWIDQGKPERAEDLLLDAQRLYEQSASRLQTTRFASGGAFGRLYYNLGNIALGAGNDERALAMFSAAEKNGFTSPDQTYKKGFVLYRRKDFAGAALEFHRADGELPDNEAVLFALATTEYRRFQYHVAQGYYLYLIGRLGKIKDSLPAINVESNPADRDLITNFYIAYNNLGCTYFKISGGRDGRDMTEATNYLRKASELYDVMSRDPDTLARLEETTIAARVGKKEVVKGKGAAARYLKAPAPFYNLDVIFHGKADTIVLGEKIDVLIYDILPRNLEKPELLSTRLTSQ
ncbi:MAG: hypothetical protein JXD23_14855 [Spirochaetales bacterium]|nr:hypothetical protein [Spirochaetales bacterium]